MLDGSGTLKLIDVDTLSYKDQPIGPNTPRYAAPEQECKDGKDALAHPAIDIWGFGVVFAECCLTGLPEEMSSCTQGCPEPPRWPYWCPEKLEWECTVAHCKEGDFMSLLESLRPCLHFHPQQRVFP